MYGRVEAEISDKYLKTWVNKTKTICVVRFSYILGGTDTLNVRMLTIVLLAFLKTCFTCITLFNFHLNS